MLNDRLRSTSNRDVARDPVVCASHAFLERHAWLPPEYGAHSAVVASSAANAFRAGDVIQLQALFGDASDKQREIVDRDQMVTAEIDRLVMPGLHEPMNAFDA